jgi:hypothetical protein
MASDSSAAPERCLGAGSPKGLLYLGAVIVVSSPKGLLYIDALSRSVFRCSAAL